MHLFIAYYISITGLYIEEREAKGIVCRLQSISIYLGETLKYRKVIVTVSIAVIEIHFMSTEKISHLTFTARLWDKG